MNKPRRTTISVVAAVLFALAALPATASAHVQNGPASMTYPDRLVGTQSDPQTETVVVFCTVPNMMDAALCMVGDTFTPNPVFSGANPGDFAQTNNCGAGISNVPGLNPGVNSCQFFITFKPTAQGTRTATLTLGTGATGSQPQPVSLSGVGILPAPTTPAATGQRAAALAKCKKKKSKKARKKCKKKANLLPV